jgi:hypothetical protein
VTADQTPDTGDGAQASLIGRSIANYSEPGSDRQAYNLARLAERLYEELATLRRSLIDAEASHQAEIHRLRALVHVGDPLDSDEELCGALECQGCESILRNRRQTAEIGRLRDNADVLSGELRHLAAEHGRCDATLEAEFRRAFNAEDERDTLTARLAEQLQATRDVDDLRMAEIGELTARLAEAEKHTQLLSQADYALRMLVGLKDGPRDGDYERDKVLAWQLARAAVDAVDEHRGTSTRAETTNG